MSGDIQQELHSQQLVEQARSEFGKIDILVNNAAFQMTHESLEEISSEEFDRTFKTNIYAMFYLCKAAVPYKKHDEGQRSRGGRGKRLCNLNAHQRE